LSLNIDASNSYEGLESLLVDTNDIGGCDTQNFPFPPKCGPQSMPPSFSNPENQHSKHHTVMHSMELNESPLSSHLQFCNFMSPKKKESGSHYTQPSTIMMHKGAMNEVALGQEVHGSFRKIEKETSNGMAAGKNVCAAACLQSAQETFIKTRMVSSTQQVKWDQCNLDEVMQ